MSVEVRVPTMLQRLVGGARTVQAEGKTVGDVLDDLERRFPGLKERIIGENGEILRFVNIYLNDEDIRYLQKLGTPVA
ncbi:MAG: molybdopterin synthase sulfur carrier subunit, partial [Chloroflexota bacterium]